MNWIKKSVLATAALVFLTLGVSNAAAQAPVVSWVQVGSAVQITWTVVPGASVYELFIVGVSSQPFTTPLNSVTVDPAPPGSYVIQVRGRAGNTVGDLSSPVTVIVGGGGSGGCLPLTAPTIGSEVSGNVVTITWGAVPGAIGYRLQVGTSPGATQFPQDFAANVFSFTSPVPAIGTFYARVLAANACGTVLSSVEHSFTVGAPTPGPAPNPGGDPVGPRAPNPPPGQLLPRPTYAAAIVTQMANAYRGEFLNMCRNHTWLYRVLSELRKIDTRWGLNYVRGRAPRVSDDVLAYNPTDLPDEMAQQIYLWDTVFALDAGCDTSRQDVWFNDIVNLTWPVVEQRLPNWELCANRWCAQWTIAAYRAAGWAP